MSKKRKVVDQDKPEQDRSESPHLPELSVTEVRYTCKELGRLDDFIDWLEEGGEFVINGTTHLDVLWLADTVRLPQSPSGPWSLRQWFDPTLRCSDCVSQLQRSNLLNSLKLINWELVSKGKKLLTRPSMLASLMAQCRIAVKSRFSNGSTKEIVRSFVNLVREYALCEDHKDCVSVQSPCSISELDTVNIGFKRGDSFTSQRLTGYPDMTVQLTSMPHVVVITAELKNSGCEGIQLNDCYKSRLGQLFAYTIGHVLVSIGHGVDLKQPIYGIYMEANHLVLTRGLILHQGDKYTLRLESTTMGETALNIFTERGAAVLLESIHTIISTCSSEEPEHDISEDASAISIDVELNVPSDTDTVILESGSDCTSKSDSSSQSSSNCSFKAKFQYLSDSVLYVMTESDEAAEH